MQRLQHMAIRWASRPCPSSSVQSKCRVCQSRPMSNTLPRYSGKEEEQEAELKAKAKAISEEKSALDAIFDSPDAFDRGDGSSSSNAGPSRRSQSQAGPNRNVRLPRAILGDTIDSNKYTSHLNQEWDPRANNRRDGFNARDEQNAPFYNRGNAYRGDHTAQRRDTYRGTMTPNEEKVFKEVFSHIFGSDGKGKREIEVFDDGLFGSTLDNQTNEKLHDFRNRAIKNWDSQSRRIAQKKKGLSAILREGIVAESVSEDELEGKIDEAREEISACQTVADTWQWAAKNVWGADRENFLEQQVRRAEEEEGSRVDGKNALSSDIVDQSSTADSSSSSIQDSEPSNKDSRMEEQNRRQEDDRKAFEAIPSARFGMSTPYYAPVLSILLIQLRERFKSPQTALSILRIARNLGPDSFVLGCTPQLYAQALRTRWIILRDLQGSKDILQEAKDTGILGSQTNLSVAWEARRNNDRRTTKDESDEEVIRSVVSNTIKNEVRQHIVEGMSRLPPGQTSHAYERQLEMVAEMDHMIGKPRILPPIRPKRIAHFV